jgi:DNA-binding transcriptional MerR regulator
MVQPTVRGANGYRTYSDNAIKLLLFIKRAQSLGITLKEIKPLLSLASQGQQPCSHVRQLARNHLEEIDQKIRQLQMLQRELRTLLKRKVARPHANEVCPILERRILKSITASDRALSAQEPARTRVQTRRVGY